MKTDTRHLAYSQSLDEIRYELSEAELSGITDEEYIALLSKHTTSLVNFVEQLSKQNSALDSFDEVLHVLFKDLLEPICVIDKDFKLLFFNRAWKNYLQATSKGTSITDIYPDSEKDFLVESLKSATNSGTRAVFTISKGRSTKLISVLPFKGFDKETKFMLMAYNEEVVNDIKTENTVSKVSSVETPELKDAFLDMIDGFYFILNKNLRICYVAGKVEEKLGVSPNEIMRQQLTDWLDKTSLEVFEDSALNLLKLDAEKEKTITIGTAEVGKKKRIFQLVLRRHNNGGQLFGLCKDITEHKRKEQILTKGKRNAEINDKLKSNFLANMSHEIRTPLNGIVGFSTMLGQDNITAEKRNKYQRIVRSSTMHLLNLVSDIIDISKIEADQLQMVITPVNVHQLLSELQATFIAEAERLGKTNVKIIKQTARAKSGLFIKNDDTRLRQVLTNLISNALKFTDEGSVTFGYRFEEEDKICFFVKDTGPGMSVTVQKSIFVRYKQTEEGKKYKHKGFGIGLAISKGIVKLMHGTMGISSVPGEGSEFYFTIPIELDLVNNQ